MGRHRRTRNEKNIRKNEATDEWEVYKKFKHLKKVHVYDSFKTFREAKSYRNQLDKTDSWIRKLPDNKKIQVLKRGKNYASNKNGGTYIYKTINYVQRCYGKYKTPEDAEKVINQLILNNWDWNKLPEELKQLRIPDENSKYIIPDDLPGHVFVKRHIDGENRNYGAYPTRREAYKVINYLEEHNWPKELPLELIDLQCQVREPKHYSSTGLGTYSVTKSREGKQIHYGTYATEKAAQHAVDELKKHGWDYEWFMNNRELLNCNQRYNPHKGDMN